MSVDVSDFDKEVVQASMQGPILVDLWAPWCGPCKSLTPVLEQLEAEAAGAWTLAKINVDDHPQVAQMLQVQSIPQVMLIANGEVVSGFAGAQPEQAVRTWLSQFLDQEQPQPEAEAAPNDLEVIKNLLDQQKEAAAVAPLKTMLAEDEDNQELRLLLGRALLWTEPEQVEPVLEKIESTGKSADEANHLRWLANALTTDPLTLPAHEKVRDYFAAGLKALQQRDYEAALDQFLEVLYRNRDYHEDGARLGFIAVFGYLGRKHPIVKSYQRRFEMALFA